MSYAHIPNLYKAQDILLFKECYALEKIHGSSAHISWNNGGLTFFAGGNSHETFLKLFDMESLMKGFLEVGQNDVTVYGEAYGGKCQGMSKTYGKDLRFIVFEVLIGDSWLSVPQAEDVAKKLGLEFVWYVKIPATVEAIDEERDKPSEQARRNGIADPMMREGVVLRPLIELRKNNGDRIMAKHKRPEFSERVTIPEVDPTKRQILEDAEQIAMEWVTDMRLVHVLDKLGNPRDMSLTPTVIAAMIEDVTREAAGEIVDDKMARKAIGRRTVQLYKKLVQEIPQ